MDVIELSRIQFASTTLFHFLFVPLSIGLAFIISIMETMYVVKRDEQYKRQAKFWGHLFLINFAVGVVTGILQEFQFGMNWSEYSRFVGDVFGAPLAIEALLAFFMESTFLGLWIFGWDRLPKWVHCLCIWLVSLGTIFSAFFILAANSFMQHPVGMVLQNGRLEMNDFFAILTNGQLWVEFPHTVFGSFVTGAFFITGVSAIMLLRKKHIEFYKKSFQIAITVGLISALGVALSGHEQAQYLVETQPMKMAASEGLWENSEDPGAWTVTANINVDKKENTAEFKIPYLLSYLSYGDFSGSVTGMNELQERYVKMYGNGDYIPPVKTVFWSFRIMAGLGGVLAFLSICGAYLMVRKKLETSKWFLRIMIAAISFPFIGNSAGWIMTEIGRQPWVVFGYMQTEDAVSANVTAGQVLFSLITFSAFYLILLGVMVTLFVREIKKGPYHEAEEKEENKDPFTKEGQHAFS
ncbi:MULTISPECIES: cytochrome ubiquinol oxidase subunit I [Bacillus]|uniref:Cytochrome D ubiquinol oxidase subunit I n=2 Tax=Bacillus TaxID=1386 RepID=A0A0M4FH37_9BACI|nr:MULTISPECIES: cytochrome ubiquinol oxidase subunit I [Bacillus]ALC80291.1 cytochrome D ubiquinol oxidase subunit I [Bacillus gobiensis]MBP1083876.1 cytochrome d ubiquinol oxidase subunit I [Bacillus capparidis]MED1098357.1 cytochrome ubiquinol oxidase subunit I [Bacillus capparidis]